MVAEKPTDSLLKAAGAVGALLPQAAGVAIGITFIAYYVGWRDASAYFSSLGAPWVISMLAASRFLYFSGELVTGLIVFTFISVHMLATKTIGLNGLRRCSIAAFLLASSFLAFGYLGHAATISPKILWGLSNFGGACFAIAAGTTLGELVSSLSENKLQWTSSHAFMVYLALFIGVYTAPTQIGTARARYHLDSYGVALPSVRLFNPNSQHEYWRLVEVVGDSVLLIDRQAMTVRPLFRLVKASDILSINAIEIEVVKRVE